MLSLLVIFSLFSPLALSEELSPKEWVCKVDSECLDFLHNTLLDKEANKGIYQYCKITYENHKLCCIDPSQCPESWAKDISKNLVNNSDMLQADTLTCELNKLSGFLSFLFDVQTETCDLAVDNCKIDCENKLLELERDFRDCFSIPQDDSIEEILEKASFPPLGQESCYQEIKDLAQKYKERSLNKTSLLRDRLESKDLIKCEEIKKAKTQKSLNDLSMTVCHQAQEVKKEQAEKKKQRELEKKKKEEKKSKKQSPPIAQKPAVRANQKPVNSGSQAVLGAGGVIEAGALAGALVGGVAVSTQPPATDKEKTPKKATKKSSKKAPKKRVKKKPVKRKKQADSTKKASTASFSPNKNSSSSAVKDSSNEGVKSSKNSLNGSTKGIDRGNVKERVLKPLQLAQANTSSGGCPVSMPTIKTSVVFQSVEAPQIEPMLGARRRYSL